VNVDTLSEPSTDSKSARKKKCMYVALLYQPVITIYLSLETPEEQAWQ